VKHTEIVIDEQNALSGTEARVLTDKIKVAVEGIWHLIEQAYVSRAWAVLGYASWDDYCTREFGTSRLRLPREERQEIVASLRESGLSTRAIASATGLGLGTVARELSAPVPNGTVDDPSVTTPSLGVNGKVYSTGPRLDQNVESDKAERASVSSATNHKPKRRPIANAFRDATWDLMKIVERTERLVLDDRFPQNVEQVSATCRADLLRAADLLAAILNRIPPNQ
jgi:hypothetical protein